MSTSIYTKISDERKRLQSAGLVPEWYTSAGFQMFQNKYEYKTNGRQVRGQFERIAKTAASHLVGTKFESEAESRFFGLLWDGLLSPSTPVLANMGTDRGMSVSCSGGTIDDSVYGFYDSLKETALLTKHGFGTSSYLGDIRPRGSDISIGGKASGVLPVFKDRIQAMRNVAQGTARRGAWAGYLPIDHGDFDEIADHVLAEPDDANIGWNVTDTYIAKLESGDAEAIRRFQKALKIKMVSGRGYFCFIDKVNRHNPEQYKRLGLVVKASNLCLRANSIIEIEDNGIFESLAISDFVSKYELGYYDNPKAKTVINDIEVYAPISKAAITGKTNELFRIETESGKIIECTPDHLICTKNRGWVKACELIETDELIEN